MVYSPRLKLLISREEISQAVRRLAAEITRDYSKQHPVVLGVLKGSFVFLSDLVRQLDFPLEVDFVGLSSYRETQSLGEVTLYCPPTTGLHGRHVLIVEDIVDTGLATSFLLKYLKPRGPASVKICALLDKPSRRRAEVKVDYLGFEVPDRFMVGYGLDCNQEFRNLPDLYCLEEV